VIGAAAAKLMKTPEIRLWHDQAICKPGQPPGAASDVGNIGWHQDYAYWQISNTSEMITAWIPLQDVNMENGAMRTIVGRNCTDEEKIYTQSLIRFAQVGPYS
jgi:ectoine hydroxylase-related dioxygenase (phytanoyl-CoA dioxygenase family)